MTDIHQTWKEADGDHTLALNWDINEESRVWEIGGFEGRWASQIARKYDPLIDIFEPQEWAVERLEYRFQENKKALVRPYGLWVMEANLPLYHYETDGASLVNPGVRSQVCEFRDIYAEAAKTNGEIDLCLMNIEGAEFSLIPYMTSTGVMQKIHYFWCQFHPGLVWDGDERFRRINEEMERTHRVIWSYYPSAVAWERK